MPVKGHQAVAAGERAGCDPAITDGIAHQVVLAAEWPHQRSAGQPETPWHPPGGGFHDYSRMGDPSQEAGRHHGQQSQTLTQGSD